MYKRLSWGKKTRIKWLEEGDANPAYFHGVLKNRKKKFLLNKIMDEQNQWIEGKEAISEAAVQYFQKTFSSEQQRQNLEATN